MTLQKYIFFRLGSIPNSEDVCLAKSSQMSTKNIRNPRFFHNSEFEWKKTLLLPPICGVLHGLNRESGENPGQFPLLCWLQRLP